MAFRRKDRPIYVANVHYLGDVDVLGVEPEDLDIRAWVQVPEPQEIVPGRNALVALVPMLAPYHLFMNASAAWGALYPAVELVNEASAELLKGESAARSYSVEGKPIRVGGPPEFEEPFEARVPRTVPEPEGKSSRVQEFALMVRRGGGGDIYARSRAPEEGGQAFFANSGLALLIQHVAHECDYEETIVPIAAGLGAFVGQFESFEQDVRDEPDVEISEENWAGIGGEILTLGWQDVIGGVVFSEDPRQALAELSES